MKLYLVRHGESASNAQGIHQDSTPVLSELGKQQATLLAKRFKTIPVDLILTSDFARALQTTEIINTTLNKPMIQNGLLVEIRRPTIIVGRPTEDPEVKRIKTEILSHADDPSWRHSDEETFFDARDRALRVLDLLATRSEEHVLAVTHGHFIKMLVCTMIFGTDLTPKLLRAFTNTFAIQNTSITVCVTGDAIPWRVLQWNDDAHLGEI